MQFYRYITINLTPVFIKSWIDHTSPFRCSATRPCECGAATVATANSCRGRVGDRRPPDYRRAPAARGLSRFLFVPLRGGAHHHLTSPPVGCSNTTHDPWNRLLPLGRWPVTTTATATAEKVYPQVRSAPALHPPPGVCSGAVAVDKGGRGGSKEKDRR